MHSSFSLLFALLCVPAALGRVIHVEDVLNNFASDVAAENRPPKIVLTNDDGWAVAQIRSEYSALKAAGYDVILSAPAQNKSGTGSSTAPATNLTIPCEFDSCPAGSPAEGFNATDPHLNYVNSFPVDSVRYGIQTLSPKLFGYKPDFVFSGNNIGNNLGTVINFSGTVGAATEAALEGIPSVAFSGAGGAQVSYTTLSNHTLQSTIDAKIYSSLSLKFLHQLFNNPGSILPVNVSLNVNYPSTANCTKPEDFKFVFTRVLPSTNATDFPTCGATTLPDETSVLSLTEGCYSSVSVFSATNKSDVSATTQAVIHMKLAPILSCLTN